MVKIMNPKGSEIRCSGKSEHFLPHMWHPSSGSPDFTHSVSLTLKNRTGHEHELDTKQSNTVHKLDDMF